MEWRQFCELFFSPFATSVTPMERNVAFSFLDLFFFGNI